MMICLATTGGLAGLERSERSSRGVQQRVQELASREVMSEGLVD